MMHKHIIENMNDTIHMCVVMVATDVLTTMPWRLLWMCSSWVPSQRPESARLSVVAKTMEAESHA